jgi:hypothetical protein
MAQGVLTMAGPHDPGSRPAARRRGGKKWVWGILALVLLLLVIWWIAAAVNDGDRVGASAPVVAEQVDESASAAAWSPA